MTQGNLTKAVNKSFDIFTLLEQIEDFAGDALDDLDTNAERANFVEGLNKFFTKLGSFERPPSNGITDINIAEKTFFDWTNNINTAISDLKIQSPVWNDYLFIGEENRTLLNLEEDLGSILDIPDDKRTLQDKLALIENSVPYLGDKIDKTRREVMSNLLQMEVNKEGIVSAS
ncbi:MAG: hypothetical protein B6I31_00130 [Desulfobacteraceae bacterium 4572_19]|nr:MAG: hypothetical protein B6I31_00130 [Desulfobacteraceae bacterium 4572_19]